MVWADQSEASRTKVINGILDAARYCIRCVEAPPLGGMQSRDLELLESAAADLAAALLLGWVDDGTVARLTKLQTGWRPWGPR